MILKEVGSTYVLLHWSPPVEVDHNGVIQHYKVHLKSTSDRLNVNLTTNGPVTDILIDFLQPNTEYLCSVAAVTLSPGPPSVAINFITDSSGITVFTCWMACTQAFPVMHTQSTSKREGLISKMVDVGWTLEAWHVIFYVSGF